MGGLLPLGEVLLQGVEAAGPQPAVGLEPRVDLGERLRPELVPAALRVPADGDEAGLAQHAQVLRRPRLAQAEQADELADRSGAFPQEVEDPPPRRLDQHVEGGHHRMRITRKLYACQSIYIGSRPWTIMLFFGS